MKQIGWPLVLLALPACGFFGGGAQSPSGGGGAGSGSGSGAGSGGGSSGGGAAAARPADACNWKWNANLSVIEGIVGAGRAEAYGCTRDAGGSPKVGSIPDWLSLQAMEGGRKAVSQVGLAEFYLSNPRHLGDVGRLLDEKIAEAQTASSPAGERAYVLERVRAARAEFDKQGDRNVGPLPRWFDAWEKDPEPFKLALEVRKTLYAALGNKSPAFWDQVWKFGPIPACKRVRERVFEIAPLDQPMNAHELTRRFNSLGGLGLLELARDCAFLQGKPGEGDGFNALVGEIRNVARYAGCTWPEQATEARPGSTCAFPGGDASTERFASPFGGQQGSAGSPLRLPALGDFERSACWENRGSLLSAAQLEQDYFTNWAEVASRKDTEQGVLVTFKKHAWMQEKWECNPDGSGFYFDGLNWQANRKCAPVGKERATHTEHPTLFPKEAAKEIKPGRLMSFVSYSSGRVKKLGCSYDDPSQPHEGVPYFVHSKGGNEFKKDDQVQYFFWSVKRDKPVKPGKK